MTDRIALSCLCGRCPIHLRGMPILCAECHCESRRRSAGAMEALPGAPWDRSATGGVPCVLCRKDRIGPMEGADHLLVCGLAPDATTRRVVAT